MNIERRGFFSKIGAVLGIPLLASDVIVETPDGKVSMYRDGNEIWFVDVSRVNLHDLVRAGRPGAIVRCHGDPAECIRVYRRP